MPPEALLGAPGPVRRAVAVTLPAAASAVLLFLAYPLPDMGPVGWIALVPWTVAVVRARRDNIAWSTWPVWLLWWLGMVHWLGLVTRTGWLALSLYLSAYFPAAALLLRTLRRRFRLPATLALPIVWTGLEYLRTRLLTGFPWFFLGHTQYRNLTVIQVADLVGATGVTFVVAAVNGLVVDLLVDPIFRRREPGSERARARLQPRAVASALFMVVLVAGTLVYGRCRLAQGRRTITDGPTVAAVQGNVPQEIKEVVRAASADEADTSPVDAEKIIMREHVKLTEQILADVKSGTKASPNLIVWPETMVPGPINLQYLAIVPSGEHADELREAINRWRAYREEIRDLAYRAGAPMLVGNVTVRYGPDDRWHNYNSALLIDQHGRTLACYDKMHLVPFGEYIPLKRYFPWLQNLTPFDYDHSVEPGKSPTVFHLGAARFAVAICFESTIPQVVRRLAYTAGEGKRIDFLVNISNDGWFRASSELPQHLAICTFRAVENRVGMVRAVNTGISAFIDPNGRVVQELQQEDGRRRGISGTLVGRVAVDRRVAPYSRHGDWFAICMSGILGLVAVYCVGGRLLAFGRRVSGKKKA